MPTPLDTVVGPQDSGQVPLTKPDRVLNREMSGILDSGVNPFPTTGEPRSFIYILVNVQELN